MSVESRSIEDDLFDLLDDIITLAGRDDIERADDLFRKLQALRERERLESE